MTRLRFRSVFISDVHLGQRDCQAAYLLNLLMATGLNIAPRWSSTPTAA